MTDLQLLETPVEISLASRNAWERMIPSHAAPSCQLRAWRTGVCTGKDRDFGRLSASPPHACVASPPPWISRSRSGRPGGVRSLVGERDLPACAGVLLPPGFPRRRPLASLE